MLIRKMTLTDLDGVMNVEHQSFKTPWSRNSFECELSENHLAHYYVIVEQNQVIGYGGFWCILDEGHITNIAIARDFRSKGYGKAIVDHLILSARELNLKHITLEARISNTTAIKLYEAKGFKRYGIRPKYYYDTNEDALIMWLSLSPK